MTNDHDKAKDDRDKELLEEIFSLKAEEPEVPQSWQAWRSGKSNYKPFSLQYRECHDVGNISLEKCHICGHELIICKRYGGQCRSGKCHDARVKGE